MTAPRIVHTRTDAQIAACYPALADLRPHLPRRGFVPRVRRQMAQGYRLVACVHANTVVGVAGYRLLQNLAWGRFLYVDDLVTTPAARGHGHGAQLMQWLLAEARRLRCHELHLDSGVHRFAAHRLYHRSHLEITSHHFSVRLRPPP